MSEMTALYLESGKVFKQYAMDLEVMSVESAAEAIKSFNECL